MQFVWTDFVFGLLCYIAIFIRRQKFRRYGGIHNVEQYLACALSEDILCSVFHQVSYQCFRYASVDAVHRHLIAAVGCPTECQLAHVACADHDTVVLVGHVHQY